MAKLSNDFPGFAALDEAGEATTSRIRRRIKEGTLTDIPGIGEATAEKIMAAFDDLDTPADQGADNSDDDDETPASQAAKVSAGDNENSEETLLSQGEISDESLKAGERESEKTGAEKNQLPNHDLSGLSPLEEREAAVGESNAELIAHCGAVYVDDPSGAYASRTAVRIPDGHIRIKVLPIGHVVPLTGMRVKDGDDEYTIQGNFGPDGKSDDWLKVRNPSTGKPFIRS